MQITGNELACQFFNAYPQQQQHGPSQATRVVLRDGDSKVFDRLADLLDGAAMRSGAVSPLTPQETYRLFIKACSRVPLNEHDLTPVAFKPYGFTEQNSPWSCYWRGMKNMTDFCNKRRALGQGTL